VTFLPLQVVGQARGQQSKWWGTLNQWQSLGLQVKKRPDHIPVGQYGTRVRFKLVTKARRGARTRGPGREEALPTGGNFVDGPAGAGMLARGARE
jgi:hypothetical protein